MDIANLVKGLKTYHQLSLALIQQYEHERQQQEADKQIQQLIWETEHPEETK